MILIYFNEHLTAWGTIAIELLPKSKTAAFFKPRANFHLKMKGFLI